MTRYTFQRGETITLALDIVTGDGTPVSAITGTIRRQVGGNESASMTVTERTVDDVLVGWTLRLADSSALPPGQYQVDAEYTVGADTKISDPASVLIVKAPSSPQ